jgi:hypothetical protein
MDEEEQKQAVMQALTELRAIVTLLRGEPDRPGVVHDVASMKHDLYGNGTVGLKTKVNTMWRAHVWILCMLSGTVGSLATVAAIKWARVLGVG